MRRFLRLGILVTIFWITLTTNTLAVTSVSDYTINNFESKIKLEQDLSLNITEKIEVNYKIEKHGIFRIIPYIYKNKGKTIKAEMDVLRVTDEKGQKVPYTVENYNQSKKIKIGESDLLVTGLKDYFVSYKIKGVVLDYGNGPEIYWNVTGEEWEVPILKSSAEVESPFGKITKIECFGCKSNFEEDKASFEGKQGLTVVVQIDKNNSLKMPGIWEKITKFISDNFLYLIALMPVLTMFIVWYQKGRDKKYLTNNIYYQPDNKIETNVPIFNRPHLPLVYSPINGLSPAEVGTIIDEKIDTKDIVAEIVELARLGYFKIKKIEKKGFLGIKNTDYELVRSDKKDKDLNKFQKNLLESLFVDDIKKVKISDLKNHFYKNLTSLKNDLYFILAEKKMTEGSLDKVRGKWIAAAIFLNIFMGAIIFSTIETNNDIGSVSLLVIGLIPSLVLAFNMPRKTAFGYGLHRQSVGLKYYLGKGKWREEIMEKNLFLEEMLPLAIALGVVEKLTTDMKDLGAKPPDYFQGMAINSFASDLSNFNSAAGAGLISAPTNYSGSGSWSGGSGFSGGGGGGFGGGGGGSW